jgi:hypothetical protein
MRQAGEVTYAGMCQSIYQQFESMLELSLSMLKFLFFLQMRTSRIATKGEYLNLHKVVVHVSQKILEANVET